MARKKHAIFDLTKGLGKTIDTISLMAKGVIKKRRR